VDRQLGDPERLRETAQVLEGEELPVEADALLAGRYSDSKPQSSACRAKAVIRSGSAPYWGVL
jgi:hypothetical protein